MALQPRSILAVRAFVLYTLLSAGCGGSDGSREGPTSAANHHALISLSATLSTSSNATNAAAVLHSAGLEIDKARTLITTSAGVLLKDTTIALTTTQLPLVLTLNLPIDPATRVDAAVTFLSGATVLHAGAVQLTAYPSGTPAAAIPTGTIAAEPVAAGSAAARVTIDSVGPLSVGTSVSLAARGFLQDNTEIANPIFRWSVDDTSIATVNPAGVLTPTAAGGTVHVTATTLSGSFATIGVRFVVPPTKIVLMSGNGQTGAVGTALATPFVVEVQSASGGPVPNQTVLFGAVNGSSVSPASAVTDVNGRAQTTVTLGENVGIYGFSATTGEFTTSITAAAIAGAAASIAKVSGDAQSGDVLTTLPKQLVVRVLDRFGNPVPDVTVRWTRVLGAGFVAADTSVTGSDGQAYMTYTLGAYSGAESVTAQATGVSSVLTFTATTNATSANVTITGDGQIGFVGQALANQIVIRVVNDQGQPLANMPVEMAVVSGGGRLSPVSTLTSVNGESRIIWTLGPVVGTQVISAKVWSPGYNAFMLTAMAKDIGGQLQFVQQPVGVRVGERIAPAVTVRALDASGNPASSFNGPVTIGFDANPFAAVLGGTLTRTAVNGIATFDDLTLTAAGNGYRLRATTFGFTDVVSATFSAAPPPPAAILWSNGAGGRWSDPANWNLHRTPSVADSVVIALPGTYTVNIDTTFTGSNIVLGDGGGAQPTLALASRTLTINNKLVIKPGATLLLGDNGTDVVAGTGTVENYGTIRATVSATMSAALTMDAAAQLIIDARPAGTLSFTVANGFTNNGQIHLIASPFIPSITFTVAAGTLVNAAGGSIDNAVVGGSSEIAAALTNLGTISATNRLILSNPQKAASGISTNSGTMTVAPNALLQISDNASFTNAGKISVAGTGNFRVLAAKFIEQSSATFNGGGSLAVQSGTVVLDGPMTVRAFTLTDGTALVSAGGSISGANFTFIRAVVDGTGTVTNVGGAVSQIDASDVRVALINRGDLTLGGSIDLRGPVTTFAGSTMRLQPVAGGARPVVHLYQGAFTNNGILQFVGGARPDGLSLLDLGAGGSLTNSTFGTITTSSAAGGPAQITGNVSNAGIITVDPAGTAQLVVAGSYASASTAIVNLHVGPGTASSELAVIGTASFQGTLNVAALGGTPAANSSYVLFQYDSGSTVAFDTTNLPEGAASWRQDVLATGYVITRR